MEDDKLGLRGSFTQARKMGSHMDEKKPYDSYIIANDSLAWLISG